MSFVKTGVGGVLVGAAIGTLVSVITRQIDDHLIEITFTTLVAWGSFLVAEELRVSGVLSTVSAGILMGSFGKQFGMSPSTRVAVHDFWQYMGFIANSFIFLLIGLELDSATFWTNAAAVSVAFVVIVISRAILIYAGIPFVDRFSEPLPKAWRHVLVWGGLRGSLSMVLVLGLPPSFEGRAMLINLVFGVVSVSLFLQGLTMAPLMRWLGLTLGDTPAATREYELARGRALAYRVVLLEAEKQVELGMLDEAAYRRVMAYYQAARDAARKTALDHAGTSSRPEQLLDAARSLALVEREALRHAVAAGVITDAASGELLANLDARMDALSAAAHDSQRALQDTFERLYPVHERHGGD